MILCRCSLAEYEWACYAAQGRTSALLCFRYTPTHFGLDSSPQVSPESPHLRTCIGIVHDLPQLYASYDTRAAQHAHRQVPISERTGREHALAGWQQPLVQHTHLGAASPLAWTRGLAVGVAVDETLETQAGLPACDTWQQTQEDA